MEIYEDKLGQSGDRILSSHITINNICPFGSSPGPKGAGPKKCAVAHPIHVSNTRTTLGGDSVTDGRTYRTDVLRFPKVHSHCKFMGLTSHG